MLTKSIVLTLCLIGAGLAGHIWEAMAQQRLMVRSGGDMRDYARLVLRNANPTPPPCTSSTHNDNSALQTLMRSITLVERHATSTMERIVESSFVYAAQYLNRWTPDFSLGPAQIRPSTARKALRNKNTEAVVSSTQDSDLAIQLLDPCDNFRIGIAVLSWIAETRGINAATLRRADIDIIARNYNASASDEGQGLKGRLAIKLYQELVYHIYEELLFQSLNPRAHI